MLFNFAYFGVKQLICSNSRVLFHIRFQKTRFKVRRNNIWHIKRKVEWKSSFKNVEKWKNSNSFLSILRACLQKPSFWSSLFVFFNTAVPLKQRFRYYTIFKGYSENRKKKLKWKCIKDNIILFYRDKMNRGAR